MRESSEDNTEEKVIEKRVKKIKKLTKEDIFCPFCGFKNNFSQEEDLLNHFCKGCNKRPDYYWEKYYSNKYPIGECENCNSYSFSGAKYCINCGEIYVEIPLQELTPAEIQIERKKQEETQIARRKWQINTKYSRYPFFLPFVIGYFALHVIIVIILSILVPAGIAPRGSLLFVGLFLLFTLPIGIVIGFLISALTGYILKRRGISKSENICPSCEAKIDHDEEICVFCGTELSKV